MAKKSLSRAARSRRDSSSLESTEWPRCGVGRRAGGNGAPASGRLERHQCNDRLDVLPITLGEANAFVRKHHRHHSTKPGARFSIGVTAGGKLVAVAIVSRPSARMLDDGRT